MTNAQKKVPVQEVKILLTTLEQDELIYDNLDPRQRHALNALIGRGWARATIDEGYRITCKGRIERNSDG